MTSVILLILRMITTPPCCDRCQFDYTTPPRNFLHSQRSRVGSVILPQNKQPPRRIIYRDREAVKISYKIIPPFRKQLFPKFLLLLPHSSRDPWRSFRDCLQADIFWLLIAQYFPFVLLFFLDCVKLMTDFFIYFFHP